MQVTSPIKQCAPKVGREPYRILFPVGWVLGVSGVALWPLFHYEIITVYPAVPHARIMIQGFAAAYLLGFLGTAMTHMLETPPLRPCLSYLLAGGLTLVCLLHGLRLFVWGDLLFAALLALFTSALWTRWRARNCMPPPGMIAVALGLGGAFAGALIQGVNHLHPLPDNTYFLSRLLLYQGFLLLPVMGVGATLLPSFTGYNRTQTVPPARSRTATWNLRARSWVLFSGLILSSFIIESYGLIRAGYMLRIATLTAFLHLHLPVWRSHRMSGTPAWLNRLSFLALMAGYLAGALWPTYHLAWLHIVFISGFGLLILSVGSRVIWAHGGDAARCTKRHPALWWVFGFAALAMLTRVTADWMPAIRLSHYAYAAMAWIAGMALWIWALHHHP